MAWSRLRAKAQEGDLSPRYTTTGKGRHCLLPLGRYCAYVALYLSVSLCGAVVLCLSVPLCVCLCGAVVPCVSLPVPLCVCLSVGCGAVALWRCLSVSHYASLCLSVAL